MQRFGELLHFYVEVNNFLYPKQVLKLYNYGNLCRHSNIDILRVPLERVVLPPTEIINNNFVLTPGAPEIGVFGAGFFF